MNQFSDDDIHKIVERVVSQTLGAQSDAAAPAVATSAPAPSSPVVPEPTSIKTADIVAIGTDHGGVDLKNTLIKELKDSGFEVIDCGTNSTEPVDYPDIARAVAELVAAGKAWRGVVIDGAGIGSCMAANKVPGIRAAMCYDYATAVNSREHNNANVLTLGAGLLGVNLARQILKTWLSTEYAGGRHEKRVQKIMALEKLISRDGTENDT